MRYKDDWDLAKKRIEAFWQGEIIDRCCISIKTPKLAQMPRPKFQPKTYEDNVKYWTDPEIIIERERLRMENTYYAGEAFPAIFVNLGAGGHAGFFKGEKHQFGESVWFFPGISDPREVEFDENSFLFKKTVELAKAFAEDSKGDYMVSMPDSTGNADALSHLLGPDELLPLMLEDEEGVHEALDKIQLSYERVMRDVYAAVKDVNEGGSVVDWLDIWMPGFGAQMQSDMSVMISNPMFKEFIMPELTAQCKFLDYPLYHFDGTEQIRHLDDILSIPELRAIQWTQVTGQKPCTEYFDELRKIQTAGKKLIIIVNPDQIEPIMENLSSKGLYLKIYGWDPEASDEIIKKVAKLTHE